MLIVTQTEMVALGVVTVVSISALLSFSVGLECPTTFSPQPEHGDPSALSDASVNLYLDESDFQGVLPGRIDLIASNNVGFPFNSLEALQLLSDQLPSIPAWLTNATVHLELEPGSHGEFYFSAGMWSLDSAVAPPACGEPSLGTIVPGDNISIDIRLPCSGVGRVYMQFCLTIGTEPFHLLNGTYRTYTLFFPRTCEGESLNNLCDLRPPTDIIPADLCLSVNETVALVKYGAGGWSFLLRIFADSEEFDESLDGYCFVDHRLAGGITPLLADDGTSRNFYIPMAFQQLNLYFERTTINSAISFAVSFTSEDETILNDPVASPPLTGLLSSNRLYAVLAMPCSAPGFVRVNISLNATALMDQVLYRRDINLHFYRNCTPEGILTRPPLHMDPLAVKVAPPLAVLVVLLAGVISVIIVLTLLTQQQKRRQYEVEMQLEFSKLPTSNSYVASSFSDPFEFLEPYDIEYNYASLEVIEELGQGAFGRVFKARAPGIQRGDFVPQEFVAVKTLKEEAESGTLEDFCKEVKVCVQFEHINIIRLLGVCTTSTNKCMIFEFMDLGNLGELLRLSDPENPACPGTKSEKKLITPNLFLPITIQIANGLAYLAELKFVHRDIAGRNCLVDNNFTVKIADFGMSREVSGMDYYRIGNSKACLPLRWMPPEALLYGKFTLKSDVWSYGILMWEVYSYGRQPHGGASNYEVIDRIKAGQLLECPARCPASIFHIMKSCWLQSPAKRPSVQTILSQLNQLCQVKEAGDCEGVGGVEGYMNLAFGDGVSELELINSRNVEAALEKKKEKELADIAQLLEESDCDETEHKDE